VEKTASGTIIPQVLKQAKLPSCKINKTPPIRQFCWQFAEVGYRWTAEGHLKLPLVVEHFRP
jgi:hypothetical protein